MLNKELIDVKVLNVIGHTYYNKCYTDFGYPV